nr:immunoglobulin heavy chain junction region [Macaca mulatta]MOX61500.1 immunoglobulin heavy chain junction region [Macaca mulatta]MOX61656.1 immunoglobulin heavy chain junction region [Macaca mulatta]MOX61849.1 immunoglobulin heavy chain junction region [Macaca mulatta]MOX61998.1 immunoglobulin heavy chain junction region [Macaca mulatta]
CARSLGWHDYNDVALDFW